MTRKITFRQSDLARALRAARDAGVPNPVVSVDSATGRITVAAGAPGGDDQTNEWDEVSAPAAPQARRGR